MNSHTLDSVLVDLADRALANPQRHGYTLPGLLNAFLTFCLGGILVETAICLGTGVYDFGALSGFAFVRFFLIFLQYGTFYRKHDQDWGPATAVIYRQLALHHREHMRRARLMELAMVSFGLTLSFLCFVFMDWTLALAYIVPLVAAGLGSLAQHYGACAMPRDPDATIRAPKPALPEHA